MPGKPLSPLAQLARETVEAYIRDQKVVGVPPALAPEMKEKAGVFVCLKKDGELRGCIGTFLPTTPNVAEEVIRNAISAAAEDPRFHKVRSEELAGIEYTVDVLSTPEPVKDMKDLDHKRYGVIVQAGERKGLLLPDLDGVDSVDMQVAIAKRKAGIETTEPVSIYRFEVNRHE